MATTTHILLVIFYCSALLIGLVRSAPLTNGNLLTVRVGYTGSSLAVNNSTALFIEEITTSGALVQTIAVPNSDPRCVIRVRRYDGALTLSTDGSKASLACLDAPVGISSLFSTDAGRVVAMIDSSGSMDLSTILTDVPNDYFYSAIISGSDVWAVGGSGGTGYVRHTTLGTQGPSTPIISPVSGGILAIGIADSDIYVGDFQSNAFTVGFIEGLPTDEDPMRNVTTLFKQGFYASAFHVYSSTVIYMCSEQPNAINKFVYDDTNGWTLSYSVSVAAGIPMGITARELEGGGVQLFCSTDSTIWKLTDNGAAFSSLTAIRTVNFAYFRSVIWAPVTATCHDSILNGLESDTDCGGGFCKLCGDGDTCNNDSDCDTTFCDTDVCAVPTCTDDKLNNKETDVDCGGSNCGPCQIGSSCLLDSDCISNICSDGTCYAANCTDGRKNNGESDIDCGGSNCDQCSLGSHCLLDSDCVSDICSGSICHSANCTDGRQNNDETDVDCGGSCSSKCSSGSKCGDNSDCTSDYCNLLICSDPEPLSVPVEQPISSPSAAPSESDGPTSDQPPSNNGPASNTPSDSPMSEESPSIEPASNESPSAEEPVNQPIATPISRSIVNSAKLITVYYSYIIVILSTILFGH